MLRNFLKFQFPSLICLHKGKWYKIHCIGGGTGSPTWFAQVNQVFVLIGLVVCISIFVVAQPSTFYRRKGKNCGLTTTLTGGGISHPLRQGILTLPDMLSHLNLWHQIPDIRNSQDYISYSNSNPISLKQTKIYPISIPHRFVSATVTSIVVHLSHISIWNKESNGMSWKQVHNQQSIIRYQGFYLMW